MFISILQALAALPTIINFLKEFAKFMQDTFGDNYQKFLIDSTDAFKKLNEAKSQDEKIEAARAIRELIKRL